MILGKPHLACQTAGPVTAGYLEGESESMGLFFGPPVIETEKSDAQKPLTFKIIYLEGI